MLLSWSMMLLLLLATIASATASPDQVKPGCQEMCGNIRVPYPFGILNQDCALNDNFFLNCTSDQLWFEPYMPARNISVRDGAVTVATYVAYDCHDANGMQVYSSGLNWSISLGSPFTFSATRNKFTVISCDSFGWVNDPQVTAGNACLSWCSRPMNLSGNNCSQDSGCCQTSIPKGLHAVFYSLQSMEKYVDVWDYNRCRYAFLAEEISINYSYWQFSSYPQFSDEGPYAAYPDTVVDWVVGNKSCQQAKDDNSTTYACFGNTNCIDNDQGYRCVCGEGFEGNPYLPKGCADIDECLDPQKYPCKGKCKNTNGGYECQCPFGMNGDGKTGSCRLSHVITIIAAVGAAIVLVVIGLLVYLIFRERRKDKYFRENGGTVLKNQRIKIFSGKELAKATNNYANDRKLGEGGFGSVYKGVLADDTQVAVKKSKEMDKAQMNEDFQHEIRTVSQVNHKNVVKLVGLCLETRVPLLVYEFISNGTLSKHIHDKTSVVLASWTNRLRVATESALALDYLHSLADPPVIHGDIKPVNILLDDNYTAKIADFGASVFISPGQAQLVTKIQGTLGYLDPEYLMTGNLTEKSDVYSFGVVLVELLTGEAPNCNSKSGQKRNIIQYFISALDNNNLFRILDFYAADEGEMYEIKVVAQLAKRCVNSIGINRPTMTEVSDELAKVKDLHECSWSQQNSEETDHLLCKSPDSFRKNASSLMSQTPQSVISIEMGNYTDSC